MAKRCAPTQQGFVRFQAMELLLAGYSEEEVARISDRDERTIRRWLDLFNAGGIDGLALKGYAGQPRKIDAERFAAEYVPLVLEPARAGETHWTALKFHGYLKAEYREELSYSTLLRYLPAYSPDFNPIEAIWRVLKDRFFNQWIAKSPEQLMERLCEALRSLLADEVASIASVAHLVD